MDPIQIVLIILALVAIWALIELALVLKRARSTVESLDRTVTELNGAVEEARPAIAKLDGMIDELQPAIAQIDPLLKQANIAVEALSADLVEVNGVLRDVSQVTGTVSNASGAVSSLTDAASEKVQRLFGKKKAAPAVDTARAIAEQAQAGEHQDAPVRVDEPARDAAEEPEQAPAPQQYYTYDASAKEPADE